MATADLPAELAIIKSFADSVDVGTAQDDLDSPDRFGRWLVAHGFDHPEPTADELDLARAMRGALRDELTAHHDGEESGEARARLDAYAVRVPLRAAFGPGAATLVPAGAGVLQMLGQVVGAMVLAEHDGTWQRIKICREDTCQVVFYDRSKNQSKTWCSMGVCGNRNKTRSYRDRQRELSASPTA
jgi:predicted RNA-binding Zn ribbon-like protein